MSLDNLPVEWEKVALGNLATTITKGTTPTTMGFPFQSAGINFIKVESLGKNYIDKSLIYNFISEGAHEALKRSQLVSGDLLFSIAGTIGKTALVRDEDLPANTNQALAIIRGVSEFFDVDFLKHQLDFFVNTFKEQARGGAMNNISLQDLKSFNVIFVSQAEQQEIVRQLDVMLAQVEQIKARLDVIPAILKKFRQSVLADAVSGKLTEEWREQNNLPLANIEKLERVVDSSFYGPRFSKDDYTDDLQNGIPTIRTTDMSDGKIIVTPTTPRIIVPPEKIEQFKVKPSDLLITRTGSIGVMALVREEYLAIPSAYLIRFRFKQNLVSSDYIYYALTSPNGQNQMGLSTTAITQPNINANSIRALEIYLPSIEEQKEIVKRVDTLFGYAARIEETIQSAQKRVNLLTQSILAKAFSGELTAEWREQHQDLITGVNSAEALLAKIQAEREASKPVKKTRAKKEA